MFQKSGKNYLVSMLLASLCSGFLCLPADALPFFKCDDKKKAEVKVFSEKKSGDKTFITAQTHINAPPRIVWDAVHKEREKDPDIEYSKVLEKGPNKCRLEQKFKLIPVFGTAVCEMHNWEVPLKRIDYKLIRSDRFKAMEGSWVLTSKNEGKSTMLELSTHLDLGIPVPGGLMKSVTSKKLTKRLGNVKEMAEKTHKQVAASEKVGP